MIGLLYRALLSRLTAKDGPTALLHSMQQASAFENGPSEVMQRRRDHGRSVWLAPDRAGRMILPTRRPVLAVLADGRFWLISAGRHYGVHWSSRMRTIGQWLCKWVVKCDAITQQGALQAVVSTASN